jgi:hypothetical protein
MTDPDRFAIVPVGRSAKAPADAIMSGNLDAVMELLPDTKARADALTDAARAVVDAVEAEQQKAEAVASVARMITDTVAHIATRLDAYQGRRAAADAAQEARRIRDALASLPDPDAPDEPRQQPASQDETHAYSGDYPDLPPEPDPDDPDIAGDQSEFPDPQLPRPPAQQQPISAGLD